MKNKNDEPRLEEWGEYIGTVYVKRNVDWHPFFGELIKAFGLIYSYNDVKSIRDDEDRYRRNPSSYQIRVLLK